MRTTEDILENFEEETEKYLLAFCEKYNIENLTKAPQNTFEAAMSFVGERIFLKPSGVTLKYNRQTVIDCDNAALVNYMLERYEQQCLIYNKEVTIQGFVKYTKISEQTMYNWLNGEYKTKIYLDKNGNVIKNIQEWWLNNRATPPPTSKKALDHWMQMYRELTGQGQRIINNRKKGGETYAET